jgi:hypothetical protein
MISIEEGLITIDFCLLFLILSVSWFIDLMFIMYLLFMTCHHNVITVHYSTIYT